MTAIVIIDDAFKVLSERPVCVRWSSITEISAYKVDAWTYDIICFGIRTEQSAEWIELQEGWDGFKEWTAEIERRFGIRDAWWSLIAYPAFQENYTILWPPNSGE